MRSFVPALLFAALLATVPAGAEENLLAPSAPSGGASRSASSDSGRVVRSALPESGKVEVDELFKQLAAAKSPMEAHVAEQRIIRLWSQSGSATVDLFLGWADKAIGEKNFARALDLLDQVIVLKPDFAEGYNRRATVYYMMDDYKDSIRDIRTTLALEPRHFGALSGLGAILAEIGDTRRAEEIYRKALALHPNLKSVKDQLDDLLKKDAGSPT